MDQFEEVDPDSLPSPTPDEEEEDTLTSAFVDKLTDRILQFQEVLVGHKLHESQLPFARRMIRSVIVRDGEEITALASRQSGKTETVSSVMATMMILMPRLAVLYPKLLGTYKNGLWVGFFAPTEGQADTLFGRTVNYLTSERALEIMGDPEIDDAPGRPGGAVRSIALKKSGSTLMMMTANPRAKIESKSFHVIVVDECQEVDDFMLSKSIAPMLAYYKGTMIKTGTPTTSKNNFYRSIQLNKRRATESRRVPPCHFEWDWKEVQKANSDYGDYIRKEMLRIGEDSDEFQMSYCCRWLLDRGMFVTQTVMDELGDLSMETVRNYHQTPVIVGIDPARKMDSTVVTVVWVDWDRPDEFGYYDHRVLNWMEIQGEDWEEQYFQIVQFLQNYNVLAVGVDTNGVGDAIASRLKRLMPRAEIVECSSSTSEQTKRWTHLQALIQRKMIGWPAHAKTRRLRVWKRFYQQMLDAEKKHKGASFLVEAPNEAHAHDDYVDSLSIACSLTQDLVMPHVEVSHNVFMGSRSR